MPMLREDLSITDAELDAATEAYVRERWPNVAEWRKAYSDAYNETRERIRFALEAAAKVRDAIARESDRAEEDERRKSMAEGPGPQYTQPSRFLVGLTQPSRRDGEGE